jgi:hypothetical protein
VRGRRAADLVLTVADIFAAHGADSEAAVACLYVMQTCPSILAELNDIAIPNHSTAAKAERWRSTDFCKTVIALLDSAMRAKLPLGRQLGEAIVKRRAVLQYSHCAGNESGLVECNTRGASARRPAL